MIIIFYTTINLLQFILKRKTFLMANINIFYKEIIHLEKFEVDWMKPILCIFRYQWKVKKT